MTKKINTEEGIIQVVLRPEDASGFRTIAFSDGNGVFLTQTGFDCRERPVLRLEPAGGAEKTHRTANGEVVLSDEGEAKTGGGDSDRAGAA